MEDTSEDMLPDHAGFLHFTFTSWTAISSEQNIRFFTTKVSCWYSMALFPDKGGV